MNKENLIKEFSKFGEVQVCKLNKVFTLLITGRGLDKFTTLNKIQYLTSKTDYSIIEVFKNDESFVLIVLTKK